MNLINVNDWIADNEKNFLPPVCNAVMAKNFLNIMFVGGPNSRNDYHIEQGEEFFYMVKGDMCLKIIEKGEPKDIIIKEGEVFVLPSRVPHSPQRNANTIGLVIERERSQDWDCLRYFCEDGKTILWHKYFHLHDLVKDFPPIIKEYFASEQYKTRIPIPGETSEEDESKLKVDRNIDVLAPFNLNQWVDTNNEAITSSGKVLFDKGEFKIVAYGGEHEFKGDYESWLWMVKGKGVLSIDGRGECNMVESDAITINPKAKIKLSITDGFCLVFMMDPTATPQK